GGEPRADGDLPPLVRRTGPGAHAPGQGGLEDRARRAVADSGRLELARVAGRARDQEHRRQRAGAPLEQRGERQPAHRPHGDLVLQELATSRTEPCRRGLDRAPSSQRLASTTFLSSVRTAWPARNRPENWPDGEVTIAASDSMTRTSRNVRR